MEPSANSVNSILKKPIYETETSSPTEDLTKMMRRRISFSGKKSIKEFASGTDVPTIWGTSYEESADNIPQSYDESNVKDSTQAGKIITPKTSMISAKKKNNKINCEMDKENYFEFNTENYSQIELTNVDLNTREVSYLKHFANINTGYDNISEPSTIESTEMSKVFERTICIDKEELNILSNKKFFDMTLKDVLQKEQNLDLNTMKVKDKSDHEKNESNFNISRYEPQTDQVDMEIDSINSSFNDTLCFSPEAPSKKSNKKLVQINVNDKHEISINTKRKHCDVKIEKNTTMQSVNMDLDESDILSPAYKKNKIKDFNHVTNNDEKSHEGVEVNHFTSVSKKNIGEFLEQTQKNSFSQSKSLNLIPHKLDQSIIHQSTNQSNNASKIITAKSNTMPSNSQMTIVFKSTDNTLDEINIDSNKKESNYASKIITKNTMEFNKPNKMSSSSRKTVLFNSSYNTLNESEIHQTTNRSKRASEIIAEKSKTMPSSNRRTIVFNSADNTLDETNIELNTKESKNDSKIVTNNRKEFKKPNIMSLRSRKTVFFNSSDNTLNESEIHQTTNRSKHASEIIAEKSKTMPSSNRRTIVFNSADNTLDETNIELNTKESKNDSKIATNNRKEFEKPNNMSLRSRKTVLFNSSDNTLNESEIHQNTNQSKHVSEVITEKSKTVLSNSRRTIVFNSADNTLDETNIDSNTKESNHAPKIIKKSTIELKNPNIMSLRSRETVLFNSADNKLDEFEIHQTTNLSKHASEMIAEKLKTMPSNSRRTMVFNNADNTLDETNIDSNTKESNNASKIITKNTIEFKNRNMSLSNQKTVLFNSSDNTLNESEIHQSLNQSKQASEVITEKLKTMPSNSRRTIVFNSADNTLDETNIDSNTKESNNASKIITKNAIEFKNRNMSLNNQKTVLINSSDNKLDQSEIHNSTNQSNNASKIITQKSNIISPNNRKTILFNSSNNLLNETNIASNINESNRASEIITKNTIEFKKPILKSSSTRKTVVFNVSENILDESGTTNQTYNDSEIITDRKTVFKPKLFSKNNCKTIDFNNSDCRLDETVAVLNNTVQIIPEKSANSKSKTVLEHNRNTIVFTNCNSTLDKTADVFNTTSNINPEITVGSKPNITCFTNSPKTSVFNNKKLNRNSNDNLGRNRSQIEINQPARRTIFFDENIESDVSPSSNSLIEFKNFESTLKKEFQVRPNTPSKKIALLLRKHCEHSDDITENSTFISETPMEIENINDISDSKLHETDNSSTNRESLLYLNNLQNYTALKKTVTFDNTINSKFPSINTTVTSPKENNALKNNNIDVPRGSDFSLSIKHDNMEITIKSPIKGIPSIQITNDRSDPKKKELFTNSPNNLSYADQSLFCQNKYLHLTNIDNSDAFQLSLVSNPSDLDMQLDETIKSEIIDMKDKITPSRIENNISFINNSQKTKYICSRCKTCRRSSILNETDINFVLEKNVEEEIDWSILEKYENTPTIEDFFKNFQISACLNNEPFVYSGPENFLSTIKNVYAQQLKIYRDYKSNRPALFPITRSFDMLLLNKFENENSPWRLNARYLGDNYIMFTHCKVRTFKLIFIKEKTRSRNEDVKFKKISFVNEDFLSAYQSNYDKLINNEICKKTSNNLTDLYPTSNLLLKCLYDLNNLAINAHKLVFGLRRILIIVDASVEYDAISCGYYIKKIHRCRNTNRRISPIEFHIKIENIENINYKNISLPTKIKFEEKIKDLPVGIKFLQEFLSDPLQYIILQDSQ